MRRRHRCNRPGDTGEQGRWREDGDFMPFDEAKDIAETVAGRHFFEESTRVNHSCPTPQITCERMFFCVLSLSEMETLERSSLFRSSRAITLLNLSRFRTLFTITRSSIGLV